jgi:hypothetical protein
MNFSLVAAMIMVLGASSAARARDVQVEAVAATGVELPELRDAVAQALVVGGARVVMRGPITGACEYCVRIKVTEISPGIFRVDAMDQERLASTTLDLSAGSRLLDRARAIAIHARLLADRPAGSERKGPEVAGLPARKPEVKAAPVQVKTNGQIAPVSVAQEPSPARASEPFPIVAPAPPPPMPLLAQPVATPEPTRAQPGRAETKAPSRSVEMKRSVATEAKPVEMKGMAPARRDATEAATVRTDLVAAPSNVTSKPQWPWIPTAIGAGAAIGAGICAFMARQKYDGLSDKTQSLDSARSLKSSGESWQTAAIVLSGVAAAGLGVGIAGFATRSSGEHAVTAAVSPTFGGGMAMMAWELP